MFDLPLLETRTVELAQNHGLSKNKLLQNANLSKGLFDRIKQGQVPSIDKIQAIAEYLNCSVDYLLGRTDTTVLPQIPNELMEIVNQAYKNNLDEFISDSFIEAPQGTVKEYRFAKDDYEKYIKIFDTAYEYAQKNNIDFEAVTSVSKKLYMESVTLTDDFFSRKLKWEYYTFADQNNTSTQTLYNRFREVYKLYCKAYEEYSNRVINNN